MNARTNTELARKVVDEVVTSVDGRKDLATLDNVLLPLPKPSAQEEEQMVFLVHSALASGNAEATSTVQFVGVNGGEGASTVAKLFARVASDRVNRTVCYVDINVPTAAGAPHSRADFRGDAESNYYDNSTFTIPKFVMPLSEYSLEQLAFVLNILRSKYSMVVIDSPAISQFPESAFVSKQADGVVVVLESEKTYYRRADDVVKRISISGGKVLGVVLNKHKPAMPSFLRRMFGYGF